MIAMILQFSPIMLWQITIEWYIIKFYTFLYKRIKNKSLS